MPKHILWFSLLLFAAAIGCSSPQSSKTDDAPKETPKDEPECFAGCMINSSGGCTTEGNVMDWSGSQMETIECDPRCCQRGAQVGGSADLDGDGIPDDSDQCPDQPEDFDGFQDEDGCPDPDNDGDQIPDESDLCPLDPEDYDGFQDADGCPDP